MERRLGIVLKLLLFLWDAVLVVLIVVIFLKLWGWGDWGPAVALLLGLLAVGAAVAYRIVYFIRAKMRRQVGEIGR